MLLARRLDGGDARRGGQSRNALAQFRVVALQPAQHLQEPVTGLARQKLCQQGIPACAQTVFLRNLSLRSNTTHARLSPNLVPGLAATLGRCTDRYARAAATSASVISLIFPGLDRKSTRLNSRH